MQKNKFLFIVLVFCFSASLWAFPENPSKTPVQVVPLYKPKDTEIAVHQFLFPLIVPYIQDITSNYNEHVKKNGEQIHKVFISEIYRNPSEQRNNHFTYITEGKGLLSFLKLYDPYNDQFVVQFLHIVLPIYSSPSQTKTLLGKLNSTLDKVLKSPFDSLGGHIFSRFLSQNLKILDVQTFSSVYPSMSDISKDAAIYYDLNPGFLQSVQETLAQKIRAQYPKISKTTLNMAVKENFDVLFVSEIFNLIQNNLRKTGNDLFSDPIIGKELSGWFKTAPAFSQHGLLGVPQNQLASLGDFLKSGHSFHVAVDIGMESTKSDDGQDIWNINNSYNTLKLLKQIIFEKKGFISDNYRFTLVPEHFIFSAPEKAVHMEFIMSYKDNPIPILKTEASFQPNTGTQVHSASNRLLEDANMDKNFELPNRDSNAQGVSRSLNMRSYQRLLGEADQGNNKNFEHLDIANKNQQNITTTPHHVIKNIKNDLEKNNDSRDSDSDLDSSLNKISP